MDDEKRGWRGRSTGVKAHQRTNRRAPQPSCTSNRRPKQRVSSMQPPGCAGKGRGGRAAPLVCPAAQQASSGKREAIIVHVPICCTAALARGPKTQDGTGRSQSDAVLSCAVLRERVRGRVLWRARRPSGVVRYMYMRSHANAASGPWPLPAAAVDDSSGNVVPVTVQRERLRVVPSRVEGEWWDAIYPSFQSNPLLVGVSIRFSSLSSRSHSSLRKRGRRTRRGRNLLASIDRERTRWPSEATRDDTKRKRHLCGRTDSIEQSHTRNEPRSKQEIVAPFVLDRRACSATRRRRWLRDTLLYRRVVDWPPRACISSHPSHLSRRGGGG
ncbi:hypothetical protein F5X68DRAFT_72309 [Plectosphaerella plurivora]|uniref:Uncharacterized protein n=1 Tax=Plectosphaerella plurivora TaxID=936078 RepID=A0A9P8VGG9_9PEZI|nr:hypothetical protein F5X68DRAFT_72309 [Plectosphaerella plurivora]